MHFMQSGYFCLLLILPLLVIVYLYGERARRARLERFGEASLVQPIVSIGKRRVKFLLLMLSAISILCALARPHWGTETQVVRSTGIDLLIAVDVSASMSAQDVPPSRLEAAKRVTYELAENFPGSRLGLTAFAGEDLPLCPMTMDHEALRIFIDMLDIQLVSKPGTSFTSLFKGAIASFKKPGPSNKALVILSDGEDHDEESTRWAKEAAKEGIVIYTIGLGSEAGSPIPIFSKDRLIGFKKDAEGNTIVTRLNEPFLKKAAETASGRYFRFRGSEDIDSVVREISNLKAGELSVKSQPVSKDRFYIPLLVGVWLLVFEACLGERRTSLTRLRSLLARPRRGRARAGRRAMGLVFLLTLALPNIAGIDDADVDGTRKNNLGNTLYREQKYGEAVKQYLDAFEAAIKRRGVSESKADEGRGPVVIGHNLGNALYKHQFYEEAIKIYNTALSLSEEDAQWKAKLNYNLGNVYYTMSEFKRAVDYYKQALKLDPYDREAKFNLELAVKRCQDRPKTDPPKNSPEENQNKGSSQHRRDPADSTPSRGQPSPSIYESPYEAGMTMEQALRILDALKDQDRKLPMRPSKPMSWPGGKDW